MKRILLAFALMLAGAEWAIAQNLQQALYCSLDAAKVYALTTKESASEIAEAAYSQCGDLWGRALINAGRLVPAYQEEAKKQIAVSVFNARAKAATQPAQPAPAPTAKKRAY